MYLWFYVLLREDDAETYSTADKVRILSVTISTASVVIRGTSGAVTTTASERVCPALGRALRVDRRTYTIVFPFEIVKAPFQNVASHVVKTEFVRRFFLYSMGGISTVAANPISRPSNTTCYLTNGFTHHCLS